MPAIQQNGFNFSIAGHHAIRIFGFAGRQGEMVHLQRCFKEYNKRLVFNDRVGCPHLFCSQTKTYGTSEFLIPS